GEGKELQSSPVGVRKEFRIVRIRNAEVQRERGVERRVNAQTLEGDDVTYRSGKSPVIDAGTIFVAPTEPPDGAAHSRARSDRPFIRNRRRLDCRSGQCEKQHRRRQCFCKHVGLLAMCRTNACTAAWRHKLCLLIYVL